MQVGTTWCLLGASELSIVFLNDSDFEREKEEIVGVSREGGFQSEPSKIYWTARMCLAGIT